MEPKKFMFRPFCGVYTCKQKRHFDIVVWTSKWYLVMSFISLFMISIGKLLWLLGRMNYEWPTFLIELAYLNCNTEDVGFVNQVGEWYELENQSF